MTIEEQGKERCQVPGARCQAMPMLVVDKGQGVVTGCYVGEMSEDELLVALRTAGLNLK